MCHNRVAFDFGVFNQILSGEQVQFRTHPSMEMLEMDVPLVEAIKQTFVGLKFGGVWTHLAIRYSKMVFARANELWRLKGSKLVLESTTTVDTRTKR